jgi:hypothetical protein
MLVTMKTEKGESKSNTNITAQHNISTVTAFNRISNHAETKIPQCITIH